MVADIARVSYDPSRQYRAQVSQQGRVTLEADSNEASIIATETLRRETIDIFGPATALGDGYKVSAGGSTITIATGVFYLGGWRLELDTAIDLAAQPDWIDAPRAAFRQGDQVIALLLTEQSITAVEDQALREVALGGPDSAARDRLMQHFLRVGIDGNSCAAGAKTIDGLLSADGVAIDPATLQIVSQARLQAGFVPGPPATDPCTPAAAGGYLGADNQMVRVTVTAYDPGTGTGTLLWGWNNASLLYGATADDPVTLTLTNVPVDEEHAPQLGQMVEILRTEADLGDGNLIADSQGFVTSVAQAYSFDTGEIVLADALPAEFQNDKYPLFVRLWQETVQFTSGQATPLDAVSGITVTVTLPALPSNIAARPFWHFAVRPATPQAIYPQRYLDAPQPPSGPRQWIADLAVVEANGKSLTVVEDCRVPWGPKGNGDCCCGLTLDPDEVAGRGGLQAVIDSLAGTPAVLSLKAGTYLLQKPLVLTRKHEGLVIKGCTDRVSIQASGQELAAFVTGMVLLDHVVDVGFKNLEFVAPTVSIGDKSTAATTVAMLVKAAIALTVEDCNFVLSSQASVVIGGGILVLGETEKVALRRNSFSAGAGKARFFGVLAWVTDKNASTAFDQWEIAGNRFQGLFAAVLVFAQLGLVRCSDNIVAACGAGFIFYEANLGAANAFVNASLVDRAQSQSSFAPAASAILRRDILADVITQAAPVLDALKVQPPNRPVSAQADKLLLKQMRERGAAAFTALNRGSEPPPATKAAASGKAARASARTASAKATAAASAAGAETVEAVSLFAEIYQRQLTPTLRIENNDIALTYQTKVWIGIAVAQSPSDEIPTSIVSGNRVTVPDSTSIVCGLLFPAAAVVSGNFFLQLTQSRGGNTPNLPCLVVLAESDLIQVSANVVRFTETILPARTSPPTTASWDFLNTAN
jgi:hypothetical protein